MVCGFLAENGIDAQYDRSTTSAIPMPWLQPPGTGPHQIWVRPADADRARKLLAQHR